MTPVQMNNTITGGVHRNAQNTLDISADLTELGRSNTLVVCSGVKSILDIGKTLEFLVYLLFNYLICINKINIHYLIRILQRKSISIDY